MTNTLHPNLDKCLFFKIYRKILGRDLVNRDTKGNQVPKQKGERLYQSKGKNYRNGIGNRER
jgi:hypothetical protein